MSLYGFIHSGAGKENSGPWDDKREDVALVPLWRASRVTLHAPYITRTYSVNCLFAGDG
jgi:hypothetical protein